MKKTIAGICILLAAALLFGCAKKEAQPVPTEAPVVTETPAPTAEPVPTATPEPESDTLSVADEQSFEAKAYSVFSDSEPVFSVEEGKLTLTGCSFDQAASESGKGMDGTMIVQNGGTFLMNDCTVSSASELTTAVETCAGSAAISGSVLLLSGDNAVFFSAQDEAELRVTNSMLSLSGAEETAFMLSSSKLTIENGSVTKLEDAEATVAQLTDSSLSADGASLAGSITARGGDCEIVLTRSEWTGTLDVFDDAGTIGLALSDLSSFTGSVPDGSGCVDLTLDASSHISLTDDSYIAEIHDADTSFQNITGNGFNLYYNGELEANAALESKTYALNNGGYLIPLI